MSLLNISTQGSLEWTYEQVLEWMENNLELRINQTDIDNDLIVQFTKFPPQILSYITNHFNKITLKDQIVITIATTKNNHYSKRIGKRNKNSEHRGYTLPIPFYQIDDNGTHNHWGKNWRVLPWKNAEKGEYTFWKFFNANHEQKRVGLYARDLGGVHKHKSYMVAIALAHDGILTDYIWFSNPIRPWVAAQLNSRTAEEEE